MSNPTITMVRNYGNGTGASFRVCLTDGTIAYLQSIDGCGTPPSHRLYQNFPNNQFQVDLGFRLDPRNITLKLVIIGSSLADMQSKIQMVYQVFAPFDTDTNIIYHDYLEIVDNNSNTYWIEAFATKVTVDKMSPDKSGWVRTVTANITCLDPLFTSYNGTIISNIMGMQTSNSATMTLSGNFCDPGIVVYVPNGTQDFKLVCNAASTEASGTVLAGSIDLTGWTVPTGYYAVIDCQPFRKALYTISNVLVKETYELNGQVATGFMNPNSDISNFGLTNNSVFDLTNPQPDGLAQTIAYFFSFTCTSYTTGPVTFNFFPRYLGIGV